MRRVIIILSLSCLLVLSFAGGWYARGQGVQLEGGRLSLSPPENYSLLRQVHNILQKNLYPASPDEKALLYGAASGLVEAVGDPFTVLFPPAESGEFNDELSGTFSGVGVEITKREGKLIVLSPLSGSPAEQAGIRAGDELVAIDGVRTDAMSLHDAVAKIRGQSGTAVTLRVKRDGKEEEYAITRQTLHVPPVTSRMIEGIGYLKVARFGEDTDELIRKAVAELRTQGAGAFILDLRNNPGGFLTEAVGVSAEFIDSGVVVIEKTRKGTREHSAEAGGSLVGAPLVILINEGSASAAEIVAGAAKAHKKAFLIGERTFGKYTVQTTENLADGSLLKYTVGEWLLPDRSSAKDIGVTPDHVVPLSDADSEAGKDPQLDAAVARLKS